MEFIHGAPALAVEVRSQNDYGPKADREMAEKRADYFAAGTLVVWDVDLLGADVVRVFLRNVAVGINDLPPRRIRGSGAGRARLDDAGE